MTNLNLTLLHGWGYTPAVWSELVDELTTNIHTKNLTSPRLLAPMLRPSPQNQSIESWGDSLAPSLPEKGVLIGWSLGAMLALSLAAQHPEKVRALVLIGATPCFVANENWSHGLNQDTVQNFCDIFTHQPERTLNRFIALQIMGDAHRQKVKTALSSALIKAKEEYTSLLSGLNLLAHSDLRDQLPAQPCLLLHGENDALMPLSAAQWLCQNMPCATLNIFENTGHVPFSSNPYAAGEAIKEFIYAL